MDDAPYGLIELALVFAIALGLLGYELFSIRRTIRDDARKAKAADRNGD